MPRFFIKDLNFVNNELKICCESEKELVKHIYTLRLNTGDSLILCDGRNTDYTVNIKSIAKNEIVFDLIKKDINKSEPDVNATLYQAMPKGEKSEVIVQKCTELGISKIVFFISKRSISRPDPKTIKAKIERLKNIALNASQQCGRGIIPEIEFEDCFSKAFMKFSKETNPVMFYEGENTLPIKHIFESSGQIKKFAFMVGPEGGFDDIEVKIALENNVVLGGLGKRILRTETASSCILSALMYYTDNL